MPKSLTYAAIIAATATLAPLVDTASAVPLYGITLQNSLVTFDSTSPNTLSSAVFVSGLQANEIILGIDTRPANGQLYAIGSSNRLYTLNPTTGAATQVGPQFPIPPGPINGVEFGMDFNPTIDRIRLVSDTDRNYVIDPTNGAITQVTDLAYGAGDPNFGVNPNVIGSAYTNSFAGATTTQLYGIDSGLNILVTQANSAGTLGTVGSLGVDISSLGGLEIDGSSGIAYMAATSGATETSRLYTVDLATGGAINLGQIGGGLFVRDITTVVIPEPATLAALSGFGLIALRRRKA